MPRPIAILVYAFALLLLVLAGEGVLAGAQPIVSWTAPTTYVNGEPLHDGDIDYYTLQYSNSTTSAVFTQTVPAPATSAYMSVPCGEAGTVIMDVTLKNPVSLSAASTPPAPYDPAPACAAEAPAKPGMVTVK